MALTDDEAATKLQAIARGRTERIAKRKAKQAAVGGGVVGGGRVAPKVPGSPWDRSKVKSAAGPTSIEKESSEVSIKKLINASEKLLTLKIRNADGSFKHRRVFSMDKSDNTKLHIAAGGGFACFASPAEDRTITGVEPLPATHAASKGGLGFKITCSSGADVMIVADDVSQANLWMNALKGATEEKPTEETW